jgi:CRISPR/Cas system type I-B associated protein Csh2 (Cas7 group RAMP superfamily)
VACDAVSWTCVASGGGTCTAAGSGNINDSVDLPATGSVTYTAACAINPAATGTLQNTATVNSAEADASDPDTMNNQATDSNLLIPSSVFSDGFEN